MTIVNCDNTKCKYNIQEYHKQTKTRNSEILHICSRDEISINITENKDCESRFYRNPLNTLDKLDKTKIIEEIKSLQDRIEDLRRELYIDEVDIISPQNTKCIKSIQRKHKNKSKD